jgi:chemotaxis protein MotB
MVKQEETIELGEPRSAFLPWFLFLAVLAGAGYGYWTQHRPLAEELQKRDRALLDLTKLAADTKRELDEQKAANEVLEHTKAQLKDAQDQLQRGAAQKAEDDRLLEQLKKEVGGAEVKGSAGQITVTLVDRILFKSGQADLTPAGEQVLRKFGGVLKDADKLIEVCGHADNVPVESEVRELYPTNWELSTARATNVVRFLEEQVGIKPRRLKAAGFGSSRPVASNASAAGRARNRRIEILLGPDQVKVVKGDFKGALAASENTTPSPAAPKAPRPTDQERIKAVAAIHARQAAAKKSAR